MRFLSLLFVVYLFTACASEYASDDALIDSTYAIAGQPQAVSQALMAEPDTVPLPDAGYNDTVAGSGENAPTPYGLKIDEDGANYAESKGATASTDRAPAAAAQQLLSGRWVNTDDGQEQVELTPTHYKTYYEGELLVEENLEFHGVCPDACSGGVSTGKPCFTISGPAQTDCYGIVRLDEDLLELQLLGVSNETIVYRRAD
ncbi:hypothetical protein [Neolewinella sp.]|uniref:hypothetical protein n=1 Tax=Neolewinella sp. TaxID=2993543 RepID=UPI003B51FB6E